MIDSKGFQDASAIIKPKIVGVIVLLGQGDLDLGQCPAEAFKVEGSVSAITPSKSKITARMESYQL